MVVHACSSASLVSTIGLARRGNLGSKLVHHHDQLLNRCKIAGIVRGKRRAKSEDCIEAIVVFLEEMLSSGLNCLKVLGGDLSAPFCGLDARSINGCAFTARLCHRT